MKLTIEHFEANGENLLLLKKLFKDCDWNWLEPDDLMVKALKNSFLNLCGYVDNELVCFGRIISDGYIYGLMVDILVLPKFRRNGFGKTLVTSLINECKSKNIKVIQLLASKQGKLLYERLNFQACPEYSPGMIKFLKD